MTQMLHVYLLQCINIKRRREYWSKIEKKESKLQYELMGGKMASTSRYQKSTRTTTIKRKHNFNIQLHQSCVRYFYNVHKYR